MQNRFGFKDLILTVLLVLLIAVVLLGMKQLDRQWSALQTLQDQGKEQTRLLASISRTLDDMSSNGIAVSRGPTTQSAQSGVAPGHDPYFADLKEAEAKPDFARGDYLIDNLQTKIGGTLTPYITRDLYGIWVLEKIFDFLLTQDPNTFDYIPALARSFQVSSDGLAFTFQLRRGVRFSDGEPMTADDVVFSYELMMNPKIKAPGIRSYFEKFKGVEKTGDYEVVFHLKEPYYNTLNVFSNLYIIPKHFYSKYGEEEINQNPGLVMGTGPYKLRDPTSWRPGQKIELVRNEMYWGEAPAFDKIIFNEVMEEAAQETMFRNGELDVYRCPVPTYARLIKDPSISSRSTGYAIESFLNGYYFIAWNQKQGGKSSIFTDKRVRTALTMMTDRDGICQQVYQGYAKPVHGPFWNGSPQEAPGLKPLPYDPQAARKLLAEVGFEDRDGSGVLKNEDGTPLRFRLLYGTGSEFTQRIVLFIKDNFAKAGVIMEPDPQQWSVLQQRADHRDFEALFMGWGGGDVEADPYQEFDSSQIADAGDNFCSYSNPKLDQLIREARISLDKDRRMKMWQECDRILAEDQPYTFLLSRDETRFIDNRIHNVHRTKAELNLVDTWPNPIPWYVPKPMQKYTQP
ncbi:MAG TPA: ABC transporter substrate-binding protein [Tepidisphaeraceae bacterium]|jgi:peptide/nickel transport system substrate-binding protein|nr:ABC transporter substrate-binding protein [Tepidisphaeraceae bacterium]